MAEACHLSLGGPFFDQTRCLDTCELLWDKAVSENAKAGRYDDYEASGKGREFGRADCKHLDAEFSQDALFALGDHLRHYVIVDQCVSCGEQLGEQGYAFTCPLPLEI